MSERSKRAGNAPPKNQMGFFEKYLSLWVGLCMVVGVVMGRLAPSVTGWLRGIEFGEGSQVNLPIAILLWLMITPMMMRVDFGAVKNVGKRPRGLLITLLVNWLVMTAAVWVATAIVPGIDVPGGLVTYLGVSLLFGLVNAVLRRVAADGDGTMRAADQYLQSLAYRQRFAGTYVINFSRPAFLQ